MRTDSPVHSLIRRNDMPLSSVVRHSPGLTPHSDPVIPPLFSSPGAGTNPAAFDAADALRGLLRFPSGDLVSAAAGMFSTPHVRQSRRFERVGKSEWSESATGWHEGSWPVLEIGPGMLRYRRRDASSFDRARARDLQAGDRRYLVRARELELCRLPIWSSPLFDAEALDARAALASHRAAITEWTRRSQSNLIRAILSLDLAGMLAAGRAPAMVTLTLPDGWLDLAPDGAQARRLFERFRARWARSWGAPSWIWKREFQDRGAPHWHLWVVPPTGDLAAFEAWVSENWTAALRLEDAREIRKSLKHGAHVSVKEGLRASDPKRLALYFLKESGPVAVKAYQNRVPREWEGQTVGRFWGVAGITKAVATVELDPSEMDAVWRVLRRLRESTAGTRRVTVDRVNTRTGAVRRRSVNRRLKVRSTAGWVALNDAPAVAAQIARYLALLPPGQRPSL